MAPGSSRKITPEAVEVTEHPLMPRVEEEPRNWGECPLDILLVLFEWLEPTDLMSCIQVNSYWRGAVNYMGVHRGIWKELAQAGMTNKGIDLRRRSNPKLDWRDLYISYRQWHFLQRASLSWSYELAHGDIRYLHVYKDILIMESDEDYFKKYYHISNHLEDVTKRLVDAAEAHLDQADEAAAEENRAANLNAARENGGIEIPNGGDQNGGNYDQDGENHFQGNGENQVQNDGEDFQENYGNEVDNGGDDFQENGDYQVQNDGNDFQENGANQVQNGGNYFQENVGPQVQNGGDELQENGEHQDQKDGDEFQENGESQVRNGEDDIQENFDSQVQNCGDEFQENGDNQVQNGGDEFQEHGDNQVQNDGDHDQNDENYVPNEQQEYSYMSDKMIKKLVQEAPFTRLLVLDEECYYILNQQNILHYSKWDETNQRWLAYVLARYFMCNKSIADINVYNDDVYMLLKTGLVFKLDRTGRNFCPDLRFNAYVTAAQYEVSRMIYGHIDSSIQRAGQLPIPDYGTGMQVMFHRVSVVVSVPCEKEFKINVEEKTGHIVIEYPGLTCATQHGDLLFLGFVDGKVEICMPQKLTTNGGKCEISTNVQDCPGYPTDTVEDPSIVAIEVYEDFNCHKLFVATRSAIYRLTVTHPRHTNDLFGLDRDLLPGDS